MQRNRAEAKQYEHFLAAVREEFAGSLVVEQNWAEVQYLTSLE